MEIQPRPHRHLILDALVSKAPTSEEQVRNLMTHIVESIDMKVANLSKVPFKIFGIKVPFIKFHQRNPIAWYCSDEDNRGLTASIILTTSHLVIHFWDNCQPNTMHFDLYSCSDFKVDNVVKILHKEFGIIEASGDFLDRQGKEVDSDVEIRNTKTGSLKIEIFKRNKRNLSL